MSTQETIYYADDWMCEVPGVAGSLEEVARQLYDGVLCQYNEGVWSVEPQAIGSRFAASAISYCWVPCLRFESGYQIPEDLPGLPHALSFGDGKGWTPDMLVADRQGAQTMLNADGTREVEHLVCTISDVRGELVLEAGPKARFEAKSEEETDG